METWFFPLKPPFRSRISRQPAMFDYWNVNIQRYHRVKYTHSIPIYIPIWMVKFPLTTIQTIIFHHVSWFSLRISYIFPWCSHDFPMIFPFSHEFPIFPWFSHFQLTFRSRERPPENFGQPTPVEASAAAPHEAPEPTSPKSWASKRLEEWEI